MFQLTKRVITHEGSTVNDFIALHGTMLSDESDPLLFVTVRFVDELARYLLTSPDNVKQVAELLLFPCAPDAVMQSPKSENDIRAFEGESYKIFVEEDHRTGEPVRMQLADQKGEVTRWEFGQ